VANLSFHSDSVAAVLTDPHGLQTKGTLRQGRRLLNGPIAANCMLPHAAGSYQIRRAHRLPTRSAPTAPPPSIVCVDGHPPGTHPSQSRRLHSPIEAAISASPEPYLLILPDDPPGIRARDLPIAADTSEHSLTSRRAAAMVSCTHS